MSIDNMSSKYESESGNRRIQSLDKAFQLISILKEEDGARLTDLANRTGMSKGSIHTYLNTLQKNEFIIQEDGKYKISLKFVEYSQSSQQQLDFYSHTKPIIDNLAEESGELVRLVVEQHGWGVFLYKSRGDRAVESSIPNGKREYLHCTAQGKAILASLPEQRVQDILEKHGLPQKTDQTITEEAELLQELREIRETNVAYSRDEVTHGLQGVASTIESPSGAVKAAIGICYPTSRSSNELTNKFADLLREKTNIIQVQMQLEGD